MKIDLSEPGFYISGAAHALLLVFALVAFSRTAPFEDAQEAAPIDLISDSQLNEITKGEKTAAKPLPTPAIRSQTKSDAPDPKPKPPIAEAKTDVPTPPPPQLKVKDPGEEDQPQVQAATPPLQPANPAPTPPPRPQDKTQPPRPEDAEAIEPPLPPSRPKIRDQIKDPPLPPTTRPTPKPLERLQPDQIAKLIATPTKPRPHDDPSQTKDRMDPSQISQLLSRETPQQRAASSRDMSATSSLGSETATGARMSPTMWGALDGLLQDQYKKCWSYLGVEEDHRYIPQIKVLYSVDGSLANEPQLLNPPSDPSLQSLAESAIRAVRECNPLKIPQQFAPYFNQWKARILRFDPEEMSG